MGRFGRGKPRVTSAVLRDSFNRRAVLLGGIQGGVGVLLAARMGYIALAENEHYRVMAESNRVNLSLIPPRRGWILDRNGLPLAENRADFRVDIIPTKLVDAEKTVNQLGQILSLTAVEVQDIKDKLEDARGFQPVEAAAHLDWDKFAAISVRQTYLPGVVPQRGFSRFYPTGPCVGHLVGYVGAANAKDYEKEHNPLLITPGFKIGKDGLEKRFDAELRGVPGARARIDVPNVQITGKSGTAQVVGLNFGNGKGGEWKHRDHGHFICFGPFDNPRYACQVLVEHGGGSGAAMPIAKDVMTYLFDQQKAWEALLPLEAGWGGTPLQRMDAKYKTFSAQYGVSAPRVSNGDEAVAKVEAEAAQPTPQPIQSDAAAPAPEPGGAPNGVPAAVPAAKTGVHP